MATRGQAEFNFIRQLLDEQEKLREEQNRISERERKKGSRSGLGSILGAIVAALATGGGSAIATGLAGGIGSRLGSEVGERSVRGSSQIGGDFLFNQPQIRQQNFQQRQVDREFGAGQNVDALMKAVIAGFAAPDIKGLFGKGATTAVQAGMPQLTQPNPLQTGISQFGKQAQQPFGINPQVLGGRGVATQQRVPFTRGQGGQLAQGLDLERLLRLLIRGFGGQ